MPLRLLFLLVVCSLQAGAQFTDRYWTFGDSAAIDFVNPSNPQTGLSSLRSRGSCVSICDSAGQLLFYGGTPNTSLWPQTIVQELGLLFNKNNLLMENGDTLVGGAWYQEMVIVPWPNHPGLFYIFHVGITSTTDPGLYYSMVDLSYNGGLGKVIQKNVQLQNFPVNDGLAAVKHGNGRDWWVVHKRYEPNVFTDEFYLYLVTASGVQPQPIQFTGRPSKNNNLRIKFSPSGNKMAVHEAGNNLDIYDFDRCTGVLSNQTIVHDTSTINVNCLYWSTEFSPDETKLYLTTIPYGNNDSISCLIQFDLAAPDIQASMDTIQAFTEPFICGFVKLAPDSQIYLSHMTIEEDCEFFYLYCDTTYYPEIMNLSVIHQPNELGALCDFRPYSFYLGGHRSYHGLPNNPNYELGPLAGSVCDTLITSMSQVPVFEPAQLKLFFHTGWRQLFVNGQYLKGKQGSLALYSVTGQLLRREEISIQPPYYTRQWDLTGTDAGLYIVVLETEKERVSGRVVVE